MKKLVPILVIAVVGITMSNRVFAQKYFAGTVKVEIKFEGDINPQKHVPKETTYSIFENKRKITETGSITSHFIYDGDSATTTTLYDIVGHGRLGYVDREFVQRNFANVDFSYAERGDTKTICGYECKGYDVTIVTTNEETDEEKIGKAIVYTTQAIGKDENINAFQFPGLSGYPLYVEKEYEGATQITQAKEIKVGKVKGIEFLIPSDYKMCTKEQWMEEMGRLNRKFSRDRE